MKLEIKENINMKKRTLFFSPGFIIGVRFFLFQGKKAVYILNEGFVV